MDFEACVATRNDEMGLIGHIESLDYSPAWITGTQMMWSDCYVALAPPAQQARTIKIGTGVSITGTRIAPVTANSIATPSLCQTVFQEMAGT